MHIPDFKLERYFARWEFTAPYLLCSSDVDGYQMRDLLALADDEGRELWQQLNLGYTESAGHPLLRREIAHLYHEVELEQVRTFSGGEEAIFALMNVLLGTGDYAVVTWPGYQSLYSIAQATGAEVTLLSLSEEKDWRLEIEDVRRALRPNTRVIVINYPHNPTGAQLDRETFTGLLRLAEEVGAYLFSDESYRFLEYRVEDRLPAAVEASPRGISLGVLSKSFALAGLRVGWLATKDEELLRRVAAFKDYLSICNSAPSEILSLIALRAREPILLRSQTIIQHNLQLLDRFFADWSDVLTWVRPQAGSIGFPRLLQGGPIAQFARELVEQNGVLLLPATVYDHPADHFRIGFGRLNMSEALIHLEQFLTSRFG
jgi:aspartate/methionine/tyrosine aminotransferase